MALYREQTRTADTGTFAPSTQFPGDEILITLHDGTTRQGVVWYGGRPLKFGTFRDLLLGLINGVALRGAFTVQGVGAVEGSAVRRIYKVTQ